MLLEDLHICSGRMSQTMRLCVCCRVLPSSEEYNRVQNQTFWTNKHPESHHLLLWSGAVYQWDEISEMTFVKLSSLPFIILLSTELTSILRCLCTVMLTADREDDLNLDTETLSVCHLWLSKLPFLGRINTNDPTRPWYYCCCGVANFTVDFKWNSTTFSTKVNVWAQRRDTVSSWVLSDSKMYYPTVMLIYCILILVCPRPLTYATSCCYPPTQISSCSVKDKAGNILYLCSNLHNIHTYFFLFKGSLISEHSRYTVIYSKS